jgi:hypothetical protein
MEFIVIFLLLMVLSIMISGSIFKSRDSFYIKFYGLKNHTNKYLIQNIINFIFCVLNLIMAYLVYYHYLEIFWIVIIPLIIRLVAYFLKKYIK